MANRAERNQNQRLATAILAAKGIKMEDWLNDQYQEIITDNTSLLIKSMAAQRNQPTRELTQEDR